jgi:molybdopterin-guanine dinucleotide biosynthesis protein A
VAGWPRRATPGCFGGLRQPFVSPELGAYLARNARPRRGGPRLAVGLDEQPFTTALRRCAVRAVLRGQHRIADLYAGGRGRYGAEAQIPPNDPAGHSFINITTPEDLARARQLLACERSDAG